MNRFSLLVSDVGGAQACGLRGVLVRTGKYRPTDENHPKVKPDKIVDNLSEIVEILLSHNVQDTKEMTTKIFELEIKLVHIFISNLIWAVIYDKKMPPLIFKKAV